MKTTLPISIKAKPHFLMMFLVVLFVVGFSNTTFTQPPPPPRPITLYVNPLQGLIFGAFFQGPTGGTVTVNPNGSRVATGDLILANMGMSYSPAIFEIEANPGTLITIINGPDVNLSGSNGGTIRLQLGTASTGKQFIASAVSPTRTEVRIGGTLTIGNTLANPPGNYSGSFMITFAQQ